MDTTEGGKTVKAIKASLNAVIGSLNRMVRRSKEQLRHSAAQKQTREAIEKIQEAASLAGLQVALCDTSIVSQGQDCSKTSRHEEIHQNLTALANLANKIDNVIPHKNVEDVNVCLAQLDRQPQEPSSGESLSPGGKSCGHASSQVVEESEEEGENKRQAPDALKAEKFSKRKAQRMEEK